MLHNLAGMAQDLVTILRGRRGDHRCELDCEWQSGRGAGAELRLLDPRTSAWSVQLEVRVAGSLDEERLRRALAAAVGRGVRATAWRSSTATTAPSTTRGRAFTASGFPSTGTRRCMPSWLGTRTGDVLMLNLNHAATDGFGAAHVLRRIARAYGGEAVAPLRFLAGEDLPVGPATAPIDDRAAQLSRRPRPRARRADEAHRPGR